MGPVSQNLFVPIQSVAGFPFGQVPSDIAGPSKIDEALTLEIGHRVHRTLQIPTGCGQNPCQRIGIFMNFLQIL